MRIENAWVPSRRLLVSGIGGVVRTADVERWRDGLHRAAAAIPDGTTFRLLFDVRGFEPEDLSVHRAMREVIPRLLAAHGLRPAFIDLFDERPELPVHPRPRARCTAFANVHHDEAKMADYRRRIGRDEQGFFTDRAAAEAWLESRP